MTTRNDITGDSIRTGMPDKYDSIDFSKKESWAETAKRLKAEQEKKGVFKRGESGK